MSTLTKPQATEPASVSATARASGSHQPPAPAVTGWEPTRHRWTFEEFIQLGRSGLPAAGRTELIDGEIFDVPSQNNPHVAAISNTNRLLVAAFDESYWLTVQSTVRLRRGDGPEPDFAVRPGPSTGDDGVHPHPLLVIEVSDETLLYDQVIKSSLYAANGVADYWVVNVNDRQVEVYRGPVEDASRRHGWRYGSLTVYRPGDFIAPLAKPDARLEVGRMLP